MITGKYDRFVTLDGAEFPFDPYDKASRREASKAAEAHNAEVIAAREQAAGRQLTTRELREGIAHPETRTVAEQITVRTNQTPPDTSDWAAQRLAELRANPGWNAEL